MYIYIYYYITKITFPECFMYKKLADIYGQTYILVFFMIPRLISRVIYRVCARVCAGERIEFYDLLESVPEHGAPGEHRGRAARRRRGTPVPR